MRIEWFWAENWTEKKKVDNGILVKWEVVNLMWDDVHHCGPVRVCSKGLKAAVSPCNICRPYNGSFFFLISFPHSQIDQMGYLVHVSCMQTCGSYVLTDTHWPLADWRKFFKERPWWNWFDHNFCVWMMALAIYLKCRANHQFCSMNFCVWVDFHFRFWNCKGQSIWFV